MTESGVQNDSVSHGFRFTTNLHYPRPDPSTHKETLCPRRKVAVPKRNSWHRNTLPSGDSWRHPAGPLRGIVQGLQLFQVPMLEWNRYCRSLQSQFTHSLSLSLSVYISDEIKILGLVCHLNKYPSLVIERMLALLEWTLSVRSTSSILEVIYYIISCFWGQEMRLKYQQHHRTIAQICLWDLECWGHSSEIP